MDVLEAGAPSSESPRTSHRVARVAVVIAAILVAVTAMIGGARWWVEQSERSDRLEIQAVTAIGPFAVTSGDLPADWPQGLVTPALRLRMDVSGDPSSTMRVEAAGGNVAYATSGGAAVIPAGEEVSVDLVVIPADCGALDGTDPASPLIDAGGEDVPLTSAATTALATALDSLCEAPAAAPALSPAAARVDVFFRNRTLVMRIRIDTTADRLVLQTRDSTGFRGLGEVEATMARGEAAARLQWLVSPAEAAGLESPTVRVRAFALTGGRAYPWVLDLRVPRISATTPGVEPRNDGVDLAEVAPRPET
jgi:hypothetical protein